MRRALVVALAALAFPASASAVFHGAPVAAGDAPWSVALTTRGLACGGALVAPDRVLTAAHCVQGADPAKLRVRLGGGRWQSGRKLTWRGAFFPKTYKIVPSPTNPDEPLRSATLADVAVIVLAAPVRDVAPLALATDATQPGEATATVGRGRTGPPPAGTTEAPRSANQTVQDPAACAKAYDSLFVVADHLCTLDATSTASQACSGDSGSPVTVQRDGHPAVAGVVSWGGETQGRDCGEGLPDVATRVDAYMSLITGAAPAQLAPYAHRRVRVRRTGGTLRCVVGDWTPSSATFSIRWWTRSTSGRVTTVPGTHRTRPTSRTAKLGCSVTARTSGGWASEDSYNLL
ncbi:S1 family peptidase [Baekduia sp. Peel2402]|uniref:S1 family peptidase n=1 Tax=Baekduia sp. Peel2402 TaxID=3458296 RepID=UPI00403E98BF